MKFNSLKAFLIYVIISNILILGGYFHQEYLYSIGKGYQMSDIIGIAYFVILSIVYFILWFFEKD